MATNTKYSICTNTNMGIMVAEAIPQTEEMAIQYEGKSYASVEDFDANEMPREFIMGKPNVVVAYAGTKIVDGVDTGEPCVVVGVKNKVNKEDLSEEDLIPSVLPDGVITDIIEFPEILAVGTCTDGTGGGCPDHDAKYRPLQGGISAIEDGATACTLGIVVKDSSDNSLVALTNNHCAGLQYDPTFKVPTNGNLSTVGITMLQPSPNDGGTNPDDAYGTVKRAVTMEFGTDSTQDNSVDASISTISTDDASTAILDIHEGPFTFATSAEYSAGTEILKSGRTTGHTPPPVATIVSTNANVNVSYGSGDENVAPFSNQIVYTASSRFTQGGDSGSAVLAVIGGEYKVIGLHFAGNGTGTTGVANHIEDVAAELNVEAWDGSVVVASNLAQSISIGDICYERVGDTTDDITHTVGATYADCETCEGAVFSSSSDSSSSSLSSSSQSSSSQSSSSSSDSDSTEIFTFSSSSSSSSSSYSSSSTLQLTSSSSSSTERFTSSSQSESDSSSSDSSSSSSSLEVFPLFESGSVDNFAIDSASSDGINFSWDAYEDADGYLIERKLGLSEWEELTTVSTNSYTDTYVRPGVLVDYRLSAFNYNDLTKVTIYSSTVSLGYVIFAPVPPEELVATEVPTGVRLDWLDKATYESGFAIERKQGDGEFQLLYFSLSNQSFFVDENIVESDIYTYRIKSYVITPSETYFYSNPSNEVSIDYGIDLPVQSDSQVNIQIGLTGEEVFILGSNQKVYVEDPDEGEHDWSVNNDKLIVQQHDTFANVFSLESGSSVISVQNRNDRTKGFLNVSSENRTINQNPIPPTNLKLNVATQFYSNISWNNTDSLEISHYDIYRIKKENSLTVNDLIDFTDLSKNKIASVPSSDSSLITFTDYGLESGSKYFYTVAAVSKFGKSSLFEGSTPYDFITNSKYVVVSTPSSDVEIKPSFILSKPNVSGYIGVVNNSSQDIDEISWEIESNTSGSTLTVEGEEYVYFQASDKTVSSDILKAETNLGNARAKIVITDII